MARQSTERSSSSSGSGRSSDGSSSSSDSSGSSSSSSSSSSSESGKASPISSPHVKPEKRNGGHGSRERADRSPHHERRDVQPPSKRQRRSPSLDYRSRHAARGTSPGRRSRDTRDEPDLRVRGSRPPEREYRLQRSGGRDRGDVHRHPSPSRGRREDHRLFDRQKHRDRERKMEFDQRDMYLKRRAQQRERQGWEQDRNGHDQDEEYRRPEERATGFHRRDEDQAKGKSSGRHRGGWEQGSPPRRPDATRPKSISDRPRTGDRSPPVGKEEWGTAGNRPQPEKEAKEVKPDFGLSGALAEETNKVNGVTLVYQEPPEAAHTNKRWRLYTFKGGDLAGEPLYLHRQSCYLFGRERRVVDVPTDHPSCSKQHAVFQYRRTSKMGEDGMAQEDVRPYLMDLGSTNGTFINNERLEAQRFYEVLEKDVMKMGHSSREYVLLHEGSINV